MAKIRNWFRWFFTGIGLVFPLALSALWRAFQETFNSLTEYWRNSQQVVNRIADDFLDKADELNVTTEYDAFVYWTCYALASFLFLVGWLINAWLIVFAFEFLVETVF